MMARNLFSTIAIACLTFLSNLVASANDLGNAAIKATEMLAEIRGGPNVETGHCPDEAASAISITSIKSDPKKSPKKCTWESAQIERPSSSEAYFRNLLAKGTNADLSEFFHLWYPDDADPTVMTYFQKCRNLSLGGRPIMLGPQNALLEECAPDVLYSWGPAEKINALIQSQGNSGENWYSEVNGGHPIWATISPSGSFSYGPYPVRIKLRKRTKFTYGEQSWSKDSVAIGTKNQFNDYLLGDSGVIESWSYGTAEHYDEIVKDLRWILSHDPKDFISYRTSDLDPEKARYPGHFLWGSNPEFGPDDQVTLKRDLLNMIRIILNHQGRIFFHPGICNDRKSHFSTDRPTYFNER